MEYGLFFCAVVGVVVVLFFFWRVPYTLPSASTRIHAHMKSEKQFSLSKTDSQGVVFFFFTLSADICVYMCAGIVSLVVVVTEVCLS